MTGKCYASGEPILELRPEWIKFKETRNIKKTNDIDPRITMPILSPFDDSTTPSIGVIRCVEHRSPMFQDDLCIFNGTEVKLLEFIAEQIAPVLSAFERQIKRERTISIIKHDLAAPASMLRDTIDQLIEQMQRDEAQARDILAQTPVPEPD